MASSRASRSSSRSQVSDVTAVLALYNGGRLVTEALESIVSQTTPPRAVIVVDDGSSDDSPDTVAAFAASHRGPSTVSLVRQQNGGQGSARNTGVSKAQTEFIAFIDQDDTWPDNHLEVLLGQIAGRADLGWVYSDFCEIDGDGRIGRRSYLADTHYRVPEATFTGLLGQDLMMLPSASIIRTQAFREGGGFDTQFRGYEDDDLFLRIFQAGWTFAFEPRPVTNYRIHAENSSRQSSFIRSREKFYLKYRAPFEAEGPEALAEFHAIVAERMTRSFINDAVALNRDNIGGDFRSELIRVASFILGDIGWNMKRRVVMSTVRHTWMVPFLLRLNSVVTRPSRSRVSRTSAPTTTAGARS